MTRVQVNQDRLECVRDVTSARSSTHLLTTCTCRAPVKFRVISSCTNHHLINPSFNGQLALFHFLYFENTALQPVASSCFIFLTSSQILQPSLVGIISKQNPQRTTKSIWYSPRHCFGLDSKTITY